LGAIALAGCASFSPDGGFGAVERAARARTGQDVVWARDDAARRALDARVDALLAEPLSADTAVQVALLNNQGLQATYASIGIAETDLVQAGRLPNPSFSFSRLTRGGEREIERTVLFPVLALLTMGSRTRVAQGELEQTQLRAAAEVIRVADETRRAWLATVAAGQSVAYLEQAKLAAEAGAELGQRMAAAGNWSKLQQAREQTYLVETTARLARMRQAQVAERERLTRLLGVWGRRAAFRLPERLPELPPQPREIADVESRALQDRLDVMLSRRSLDSVAASLGLTRATRFVDALALGYQHNSSNVEPRQTGWEVELEIPLFDFGQTRVARAEATYMQAAANATRIAVDARSEVREAYAGYRTAYALARHYRDEAVPLAKRISDEQLLRYNGMLISVFELLADARAQSATVVATIEALRDFWIADSMLQMALTGGPVSAARGSRTTEPIGASPSTGAH
jgi:outer membrane protein TolC